MILSCCLIRTRAMVQNIEKIPQAEKQSDTELFTC